LKAGSREHHVAILPVLTAIFSWVNFRLAFLPDADGLLVMGLDASLGAIGAKAAMSAFCVWWPRSRR